jgi:uncharacterized damage-inducible protein DinB
MHQSEQFAGAVFAGWHEYQGKLVTALSPLTDEQVELRVAPDLRSVEEIVTHMIGARARWMQIDEGADTIGAFATWDRPSMPLRSAGELVEGLETTWRLMQEAIARWTPEEWAQEYPGEEGDPPVLTRAWILWHLIEHDLHHGGELSLTLGIHDIAAPDL